MGRVGGSRWQTGGSRKTRTTTMKRPGWTCVLLLVSSSLALDSNVMAEDYDQYGDYSNDNYGLPVFPYNNNEDLYDLDVPDLATRALGPQEDTPIVNKIAPDTPRIAKNSMLPAYCDPPNPCPHGYTSEDGCIEDFENNAEFSRQYQASQSCMCDTEHMFNCPQPKQQNGGLSFLGGFPSAEEVKNPFLAGAKLSIAAKKGMGY